MGACDDHELCKCTVKRKSMAWNFMSTVASYPEWDGTLSSMGWNKSVITDHLLTYIGLRILALWISFVGVGVLVLF